MPEDHFASETKAQQQPPLCAVWPSCRRSLGVHRWRSHAACEAETRRSGAASRFGGNCAGLLARLASSVAPSELSPVQLLRKRHSSPRTSRWGHFPRQTTARATGRSGTAAGQQLPQGSQPVPPGEPLDGSSLLNCHFRDVVLTDRDKQLLIELRRASAMALPRCVVSRWAESLEGVTSGHQSWALLCRFRCRLFLAKIPKGVDWNSELRQRLHLWESGQISDLISKVLGQQSSGPLRRTARGVQPKTDEQRGKRACALTA